MAQKNNSKSNYNSDLSFHFGPAIFQGDVASGLFLSHKKISDVAFNNSNLNLGIGINHKISKRIGVKSNLNFLQLCGSDQWGDYQERSLQFRTFATDWSLLLEYSLLHWDITKQHNLRHHLFFSSGIAFFYFNPMAQYQNKWVSLRPLGTEGQGLTNIKTYSPFSYSLPLNIGYRYRVNRRDIWGLEFCFRKTFTDYVDDVSGNYYDNQAIYEYRGETAAHLADPAAIKHRGGYGRGNPLKGDNYSFFNITYARIFGVPYIKMYSKKLRWMSQRPNKI